MASLVSISPIHDMSCPWGWLRRRGDRVERSNSPHARWSTLWIRRYSSFERRERPHGQSHVILGAVLFLFVIDVDPGVREQVNATFGHDKSWSCLPELWCSYSSLGPLEKSWNVYFPTYVSIPLHAGKLAFSAWKRKTQKRRVTKGLALIDTGSKYFLSPWVSACRLVHPGNYALSCL